MSTIEQAIERANTNPVFAGLSEQHKRVIVKTADRLNQEAAISRKAAIAYMANLTPIQREAIVACVARAKAAGDLNQRELLAFRHFGFDC